MDISLSSVHSIGVSYFTIRYNIIPINHSLFEWMV